MVIIPSGLEIFRSKNTKNLPASLAHSHRVQFASLTSLSAPRARDLIVALRAPSFLNLALSVRFYALRIHFANTSGHFDFLDLV